MPSPRIGFFDEWGGDRARRKRGCSHSHLGDNFAENDRAPIYSSSFSKEYLFPRQQVSPNMLSKTGPLSLSMTVEFMPNTRTPLADKNSTPMKQQINSVKKVRKLSNNSDKKVDEKINNCTSLEKIELKKSTNLGREEIREAIKDQKLYVSKYYDVLKLFCCGYYINSCQVGSACSYGVTYGDGSSSVGYFVKDNIQLDRASGNLQTTPMNGSAVFGCGAKQSGQLGSSSQALDGILGFGQANSSMLSQLASVGKVKKMFAHCLDGTNGGGIFAIGQLEEPKLNSTPLVPNQAHYNVILKAIKVGHDVLQLPTDALDSQSRKAVVIDSGTTLAYLADDMFAPLMEKIMAAQPDLKLYTVEQQFTCFQFNGNVDNGFPAVNFRFENSLSLTIVPSEYLFQIRVSNLRFRS
ncbi:hypothetical protein ACSBR2_019703 [Camellia fascicularis]